MENQSAGWWLSPTPLAPLKNMSSSVGIIISIYSQYMGNMFQTTNQIEMKWLFYFSLPSHAMSQGYLLTLVSA